MREIVIVIADLYLAPGSEAIAPATAAQWAASAGIATAGRFGARRVLARGWRAWLAERGGRPDVAAAAPARVAGAVLQSGAALERGAVFESGAALESSTAASGVVPPTTPWLATPLHLRAGLSRVHLEHRDLLRLTPAELAELAKDFARDFGADGSALLPLPSGEFLLTSRLEPIVTSDPARAAGADVAGLLPQGPAAAPLRRLVAEMEMWLHDHAVNAARRRRGELPVTTLWLWGGAGRQSLPPRREASGLPAAFGADAWLAGLWHLQGGNCQALPERLEAILSGGGAREALVVAQVGRELQLADEDTVAAALARLDERFISPALRALWRGELGSVRLLLNDVQITVGRASRFKLWRRRRGGLKSFA